MFLKRFLLIIGLSMLLVSCGNQGSDQTSSMMSTTSTTSTTSATSTTSTTSEITHSFSDTYEKDETGHWKECTVVGHDDKTEKENHKFSEWTTLSEADVHKDKVEHRHCTVCEYEEKRTVIGSGTHTYDTSVWKYDSSKHWHESTCEHTTPLRNAEEEHKLSEWNVKVAATYTSNEIQERKCTVCPFKEEKEIENSKLLKPKQEITLKSVGPFTYDGTNKVVTENDFVCQDKSGGIKIEYRVKDIGTYYEDARYVAGEYEYRITLGETENYAETSAVGSFTILPQKIKIAATYENGISTSYGLKIGTIDTSTLSNNKIYYVWVVVDKKYEAVGTHVIPIDEVNLALDEHCFEIDRDQISSITLINYDTKPLIAALNSGSQTFPSGFGIKTKIEQGSVKVGDKLYLYGAEKEVIVVDIKDYSGSSLTKANVNAEVYIIVSGVSVTDVSVGMILSIKNTLQKYQSVFTSVTIPQGMSPSSIQRKRVEVIFDSIDKSVQAEVTIRSAFSSTERSFDDVRLDFSEPLINYEGRHFKLKNGSLNLGEGKITGLHNHDTSFETYAKCESCGYDNQTVIQFDSSHSEASSSLLPFYANEKRLFKGTDSNEGILLTGGTSISTAVSYKFSITDSEGNEIDKSAFTITVYNLTSGNIDQNIDTDHSIIVISRPITIKVLVKRLSSSPTVLDAKFKIIKQ